jgi:hypothetical protein
MHRTILIGSLCLFSLVITSCGQQRDSQVSTLIAEGIKLTSTGLNNATAPADHQTFPNINGTQSPEAAETQDAKSTIALTPTPTKPAEPTFTPSPAPTFSSEAKTINGFVLNNGEERLESFPIVTLQKVSVKKFNNYLEAEEGNIIVIADVLMENPGTEVAELGSGLFLAVDQNGVTYDPWGAGEDCELDSYVDVFPGGKLQGCLVFEVPNDGWLNLLYAPYRIDRFNPERSLAWEISYFPLEDGHVVVPSNPVPDEQLASMFEVESLYLNSGEIFAEIKNTTEKALTDVDVTVITYDHNRNVIDKKTEPLWLEAVFPGGIVPFHANLGFGSLSFENIDVTAYGEVADPDLLGDIYKDLKVVDFRLKQVNEVWLPMIGSIENVGQKRAEWVNILVVAKDKTGEIIGFGQGVSGYDQGPLDPGASQDIEGDMRILDSDGVSAVDHFDFYVEGWVKNY